MRKNQHYIKVSCFWGQGLRGTWFGIFSILALVLLVIRSWAWYVKSIGASRTLTIPTLTEWGDESHQRRLLTTLDEFVQRMTTKDCMSISVPLTSWHPTILTIVMTLSLLSVFVVYQAQANKRLFYGVTMSTLFVGFWGYALALLISYLIIFTEYEGIRLASFERYLSTYLLAWATFILVKLFDVSDLSAPKKYALAACTCLVVLTVMTSGQLPKDLSRIKSDGPDHQLRLEIEDYAELVKQNIQPNDKIYFIAQNTNGLERVMFYYAMLPNTISMSWCWSLGEKYFEGDVWTCNQPLGTLLDGFDYLALYRGDDQFWDKSKSLFDVKSVGGVRGLYKISRQHDKIQLIRVFDK